MDQHSLGLKEGERIRRRIPERLKQPLTQRSTVSKIVHRSQYEDVSTENFYAAPTHNSNSPNQGQCLDAQQALKEWVKDQHQKGVPLNRAMVRKKAAVFAAMAWSQNKRNAEGGSASREDNTLETSTGGPAMLNASRCSTLLYLTVDDRRHWG